MRRRVSLVLFGLAIVAATAPAARSQYYYPYGTGYGGYGFGGFGGTGGGSAPGDVLRGYGAFAEAEGVYEVEDAQARSVNTDTVLRLNQYLYNAHIESQRRYNATQARRFNLDKAHIADRQNRVRENPTNEDIINGDALNAVLDQMTDPKATSASALRLADGTVPAKVIRDIPFRDETDAITLSLDELTDPKSWPLPLRSDAMKPEREAYQKAVDDALAEDKDGGSLKPETIAKVREAVAKLYEKTGEVIPKTKQPDHNQAMNYLKGLAGLSRMLERPNVEAILSELEKVENTTVGNLVAFMHAYNLRFAPAVTGKQRAAYEAIFPLFTASRDKVLGKPGDAQAKQDPDTPPPPIEDPTALFNGMDATHLNPKAKTRKP